MPKKHSSTQRKKNNQKYSGKNIPQANNSILLGFVFTLFILACWPILQLNPQTITTILIPLLCWGTAFFGLTYIQKKQLPYEAHALVGLTLLLLGIGIAVQIRLGFLGVSNFNWRPYLPYAIGIFFLLIISATCDAQRCATLIKQHYYLFWILSLIPMIALLLFGVRYRGGIFLPGKINPTEFTKVFLVLFSAGWIPRHLDDLSQTIMGFPRPPLRTFISLSVAWGIPLILAILVGDLGMVLILSITLVILLTSITHRWGWFIFGIMLTILTGFLIQHISTHTRIRFNLWLDPFSDPSGKGYQIGQSLCAQYAGNLWGTGIAQGHPEYVPIVESDFVYAAIAEEWGLFGCTLLLLFYAMWLHRVSAISSKIQEITILAKGLAALIGTQIFLNVAGVTKALPMTGITLPFCSLGGSSLIAILMLSGIAIAITKKGH